MAYVRRSPEEEAALLQQSQSAGAPASGGGAAASGGAAPGTPAQATGPAKGSGYVGLNSYLEANRGAATGMADTLAQRADNTAAFGQQSVDTARGAFDAAAAAGTPGGPRGSATGYTGPTSIDDFAQGSFAGAPQAAQKGADAVSRLSDWEGRGQALQEAYGQHGAYGRGAQGLDTFLSGAADGGRFAGLQQKYAGLSGAWDAARKGAGAAVQAGQTAGAAAQQQYADYAAGRAQQKQDALGAQQDEAERKRREAQQARTSARGAGYAGLDGYGRP